MPWDAFILIAMGFALLGWQAHKIHLRYSRRGRALRRLLEDPEFWN